MVGTGVASFSHVGGVHYQNGDGWEQYVEELKSGALPIARALPITAKQQLIREFVLQLKLGRIDIAYFQNKFGVDVRERFASPLNELDRVGWIEVDSLNCTLTRQGLLRVDRLLAMFYRPCHRDVRYS